MENASKALLIAAAVLIVILLIAFGMRIFNSTSNVSGQAQSTGQEISKQTQTASESAISSISGISSFTDGAAMVEPTPEEKFKSDFSSYMGTNQTKTEAIAVLDMIENANTQNTYGQEVKVLASKTAGREIIILFNPISQIRSASSTQKFKIYFGASSNLTICFKFE